jgi:hypothetical protein
MASSGDENDHFFDEEKVELDDVKEVLSENDQDPGDSSDTSHLYNHTLALEKINALAMPS